MPDEACPTYSAMIDQLELGHQFLLKEFDFIPQYGWQIDPFGASLFTPIMQNFAGFKAHLIDRITYSTKVRQIRSDFSFALLLFKIDTKDSPNFQFNEGLNVKFEMYPKSPFKMECHFSDLLKTHLYRRT